MRKKRIKKIQALKLGIITLICLSVSVISVGYCNWVNNLNMDASVNTSSLDINYKSCNANEYSINGKLLEINIGAIEAEKEYNYEIKVGNNNNFKFEFDRFDVLNNSHDDGFVKIRTDKNTYNKSIDMVMQLDTNKMKIANDGKVCIELKFKNIKNGGNWQEKLRIIIDYKKANKVSEELINNNQDESLVDTINKITDDVAVIEETIKEEISQVTDKSQEITLQPQTTPLVSDSITKNTEEGIENGAQKTESTQSN